MAVVLIEVHEVHRHFGCSSKKASVGQLLGPNVAVKQIESVEDVIGEGGSSTVPCVWREAGWRDEELSKSVVWRLTQVVGT